MKRYTREFLHNEIRAAKEYYDETQNVDFLKRAEELLKIENAVARGLITDFEAIRAACKEIEPE